MKIDLDFFIVLKGFQLPNIYMIYIHNECFLSFLQLQWISVSSGKVIVGSEVIVKLITK